MPEEPEMLDPELFFEPITALLGKGVVVQYIQKGEKCALWGTALEVGPTIKAKDGSVEMGRHLLVHQPFTGTRWKIPIEIIFSLELAETDH